MHGEVGEQVGGDGCRGPARAVGVGVRVDGVGVVHETEVVDQPEVVGGSADVPRVVRERRDGGVPVRAVGA